MRCSRRADSVERTIPRRLWKASKPCTSSGTASRRISQGQGSPMAATVPNTEQGTGAAAGESTAERIATYLHIETSGVASRYASDWTRTRDHPDVHIRQAGDRA